MSCRGSAEKVKLLTEPQRTTQFFKKRSASISAVHCVSERYETNYSPLLQ
jgi:hypothetical protein